jgi:A/G-specific adenine glycosylase
LAQASEEKVLKLWQGLGYYSRARNLHKTAQIVSFERAGNFPNTYQDLIQLKGIGDYTAAAIASFSFNEAVPVVDGNVFRVLSRYFDVATDISHPSAKKEFAALALELMHKDHPATFNQAMMEFGALQCVPKNPDCAICPLNSGCLALKLKKVFRLPVKSKKAKVTNRFFNYLIVSDENEHALIQKRAGKGIWHNLYEFPLVETDDKVDFELLSESVAALFQNHAIQSIIELKSVNHKLTHQNLDIKFWKVDISGILENGVDYETLKTFPFPIVIYNFITNDWR